MSESTTSTASTKVTGVLLCRDRVAIHLGGKGPDSVKALHGAASVFAPGELQGLLAGAISDGIFGAKVAVGVDPLLEFFSTQRSVSFQEGGKAESLIDELRGKYEGRLVAESMRTALPPKTHQTAIAVPKGELQETAQAFESFSSGRVKFISTTHAMYAMAADEYPNPRKWKSEIRVFLGSHEGLVLFAIEGTLVARQIFEYSGQAQGAVASAVNGVIVAVKEGLGLDPPEGILFHVGQGDTALADLCTSMTGLPAESASRIDYDQATLSAALAFDGFRRKRQEVDFLNRAQSVTKSSAERLVPMKAAGVLVASVLGMGAFLWNTGSEVQDKIDEAMARSQEAVDLYDGDVFLLEEAEEALMKTVGVGEGFLMDRVYWADFLTEIPRILPKGMTLKRIDAKFNFIVPEDKEDGEVATMTQDDSSRYIELNLEMIVESEKSNTPEVNAFSESLIDSDVFSKVFSTVGGAEFNMIESERGWKKEISIRCSP